MTHSWNLTHGGGNKLTDIQLNILKELLKQHEVHSAQVATLNEVLAHDMELNSEYPHLINLSTDHRDYSVEKALTGYRENSAARFVNRRCFKEEG